MIEVFVNQTLILYLVECFGRKKYTNTCIL